MPTDFLYGLMIESHIIDLEYTDRPLFKEAEKEKESCMPHGNIICFTNYHIGRIFDFTITIHFTDFDVRRIFDCAVVLDKPQRTVILVPYSPATFNLS